METEREKDRKWKGERDREILDRLVGRWRLRERKIENGRERETERYWIGW